MLAVIVAVVGIIGACAGPETASIDGDWVLVDGLTTAEDWPVTMEVDGEAWGARVCNSMGGAVDRSGGRFVVGEIERTAMSCGTEVDAVEEAFLEAIASVDRASVEAGRLVLTGTDVSLSFEARPAVDAADLVGHRWVVETLVGGDTASTPDAEAWVEFASDGSFAGWTGCRDLSGTFILRGPDVLFTSLAADGDCPAELADQDGFVIGVLEAPTVAIEGDRLTLTASGGDALVLATP
jgi:heat shock protein HslJ